MPEPSPASATLATALLIDATGEKVAFCGRVFNKDRSSKNIHAVGFRFGTVTKAGGSVLTVSLQDVDLANGPPMRPDETQDQTVTIANANASFATNTWIQTAAFSADRTVAFGELVAVVIEFDGGGRLGSDSVVISAAFGIGAQANYHQCSASAKVGAGPAWTETSEVPNIILEFSDGTFGTLIGAFPFMSSSSVSFKQDTAGSDEYALEFQVPFPCKVDGFWINCAVAANTNNFDVVLYDGTSAMTNGTVTVDANAVNVAASTMRTLVGNFAAEITLAANHTYYLAVKPTQTTGNVLLFYVDVNDANHFQALAGGTAWRLSSRLDLGSWAAATTTRRPLMGLHVSSLDDGVQTGGGSGGVTKLAGFGGGLVA